VDVAGLRPVALFARPMSAFHRLFMRFCSSASNFTYATGTSSSVRKQAQQRLAADDG